MWTWIRLNFWLVKKLYETVKKIVRRRWIIYCLRTPSVAVHVRLWCNGPYRQNEIVCRWSVRSNQHPILCVRLFVWFPMSLFFLFFFFFCCCSIRLNFKFCGSFSCYYFSHFFGKQIFDWSRDLYSEGLEA